MTDTDFAWLAGLIDGETHFRIRKDSKRGKHGAWYRPVMTITMTSESACRRALEITGVGSVTKFKRVTVTGKAVWSWTTCSQNAATVCRAILPYMIVKKAQAELVIEIAESLALRDFSNGHPITSETLDHREGLRLKLLAANHS